MEKNIKFIYLICRGVRFEGINFSFTYNEVFNTNFNTLKTFYLSKNDLTFTIKNNECYHQLPSLLLMVMQCYSIQEINQTHLRRYLHEWT